MFSTDLLAGKVAFVAGGTSGINLAIAEGFAAHGANVAVLGRRLDKAQHAADHIRAVTGRETLAIPADVRDYEAIDAALASTVERFGKIDIVVSGAAGNFQATAVNLSTKGFQTVVDIDLVGTFNVFRAAYDHVERPGASFIAITAPNAMQPMARQLHACAAKAGVNMLVRCLALEWGPAGIRVNAISPGPIAGTEGIGDRMMSPELRKAMEQRLPAGRLGLPSELANAALFLGSELSSYTTGHIYDCEGGMLLGAASPETLKVMQRPTK